MSELGMRSRGVFQQVFIGGRARARKVARAIGRLDEEPRRFTRERAVRLLSQRGLEPRRGDGVRATSVHRAPSEHERRDRGARRAGESAADRCEERITLACVTGEAGGVGDREQIWRGRVFGDRVEAFVLGGVVGFGVARGGGESAPAR